jgi:hypothetical protein
VACSTQRRRPDICRNDFSDVQAFDGSNLGRDLSALHYEGRGSGDFTLLRCVHCYNETGRGSCSLQEDGLATSAKVSDNDACCLASAAGPSPTEWFVRGPISLQIAIGVDASLSPVTVGRIGPRRGRPRWLAPPFFI